MPKVELHLKPETLERARRSAEANHATLEQWLADVVERTTAEDTATRPETDPLLGLFADTPELMDQVLEDALAARQEHPLRQG